MSAATLAILDGVRPPLPPAAAPAKPPPKPDAPPPAPKPTAAGYLANMINGARVRKGAALAAEHAEARAPPSVPHLSWRPTSRLRLLASPLRRALGLRLTPEHLLRRIPPSPRTTQVLRAVSARFGVQPEVVVAVWGIETSFGALRGDYDAAEALAQLAFSSEEARGASASHTHSLTHLTAMPPRADGRLLGGRAPGPQGRRAEYFRGELLELLKMIDEGVTPPGGPPRSSWAGALGQCQFMPTSFRAYAADMDGDGRADIWNSIPDVLGSIASFLRARAQSSDSHPLLPRPRTCPEERGKLRRVSPASPKAHGWEAGVAPGALAAVPEDEAAGEPPAPPPGGRGGAEAGAPAEAASPSGREPGQGGIPEEAVGLGAAARTVQEWQVRCACSLQGPTQLSASLPRLGG